MVYLSFHILCSYFCLHGVLGKISGIAEIRELGGGGGGGGGLDLDTV